MDNRALGLLEIIAQMGTGGAAEMGGGLAYLGTLPFGGDPAAQAVKNAVQDRFTYQPRTQSARSMMQMVSEYGAPFMQKAGQKLDETADSVYQRTGSPALGAAVKTAPTALMELSDRINVGGLLKSNKSILDMTSYHGSPHDFDGFDMSKIGTGEGAQVYGHGLYFSESPDVARRYAEQLARPEMIDNPNHFMARDVRRELERLRRETPSELWGREIVEGHFSKMAEPGSPSEMIGDAFFEMVDDGDIEYNGRFYTVDIPDEAVAKFMDWDKPLSQQPQAARDALAGLRDSAAKSFPAIKGNDSVTGQAVYEAYKAHRGGNQAAASAAFLDAGIPGIRYLDAGSRAGGNGTSNFVVFDDKLVKVLKKE